MAIYGHSPGVRIEFSEGELNVGSNFIEDKIDEGVFLRIVDNYTEVVNGRFTVEGGLIVEGGIIFEN